LTDHHLYCITQSQLDQLHIPNGGYSLVALQNFHPPAAQQGALHRRRLLQVTLPSSSQRDARTCPLIDVNNYRRQTPSAARTGGWRNRPSGSWLPPGFTKQWSLPHAHYHAEREKQGA